MPLVILIADDDEGIRLAIKDYLDLEGYSVIAAKNGEEALSLLEQYKPHLLVSDIKMPLKNGYDLVKQVRQRPEYRLLPVIFLTEKATTEERIKGYRTGCDIYLPKPFELEELGAVVRTLLERSQIIQSQILFVEPKTISPQFLSVQESSFVPLVDTLTEREKQVLDLLSTGLSNVEIGKTLHLSPRTVEKYVSSLLRKTETNNRSELVRFALDNNLV
jgi:DNA-binding NarL/FixJ family response regulator